MIYRRFKANKLRLVPTLVVLLIVASACGQVAVKPAEELDFNNWESVVAEADGSTVRWHMWGGNDNLNTFVDEVYAPALEEFGVDLERVPLADTADAVAAVISEVQAGEDNGSVDLIWINGTNASTMAEQELLLPGWSRSLPNARFVDFDNPSVASDFGRGIGAAQSPWASAQMQLIYDSADLDAADLPRSYEDLATYACAKPGRVTYVNPNDFHGARFLNGALYELTGEIEPFATFDESLWAEKSQVLWDWLNKWKSCLWREGKTYPADEAALHNLLANSEVDFSLTLAVGGAAPQIEQGALPTSARAFVFDGAMVGDTSYVAIPKNASNPAGAALVANLLLQPELQAQQIAPEAGGSGLAIDTTRVVEAEQRSALEGALTQLPLGAVSPKDLADSVAPVAASEYQAKLAEDWRPGVLES